MAGSSRTCRSTRSGRRAGPARSCSPPRIALRGDLLIATSALVLALIAFGRPDWPARGFAPVATAAILIGLGYTVFSEWLNTEIRRSWAYAELMPVLPFLGTGLSPLAQWIVIPSAAFWWARRGAGARADRTAQPRTAVY